MFFFNKNNDKNNVWKRPEKNIHSFYPPNFWQVKNLNDVHRCKKQKIRGKFIKTENRIEDKLLCYKIDHF